MASFTQPEVEVEAVADAEVDASGAPRRRWLFVALVVLLSCALIGGRAGAEAMPASPTDGKQSQKLPVLVTPRERLADGQGITAVGNGFVPGERVGIVQCAAEAGINGVTSCDRGTVQYATASTAREVQAPIAVAADVALDPLVTAEGSGVPCDGGCAIQIDHVGWPEATGAPMPAPIARVAHGPIDPGPVPTLVTPATPMSSPPSSELPSSTEPAATTLAG
jgi:hypothetical protein